MGSKGPPWPPGQRLRRAGQSRKVAEAVPHGAEYSDYSCFSLYTYIYIYLCIPIYIYMHIQISIRIYVYIYVSASLFISISVYIYTHTHTLRAVSTKGCIGGISLTHPPLKFLDCPCSAAGL